MPAWSCLAKSSSENPSSATVWLSVAPGTGPGAGDLGADEDGAASAGLAVSPALSLTDENSSNMSIMRSQ